MNFVYDDGGKSESGYKGYSGDCVTRAIAIVTQKPYKEVYNALNDLAQYERIGKRKRHKSSARNGVYRQTYEKYLLGLGYCWIPTMHIGKGCTVHLKANELPQGRLIVRVSKHMVAVIDGVIHDTHNPDRGESRCVYGYFIKD